MVPRKSAPIFAIALVACSRGGAGGDAGVAPAPSASAASASSGAASPSAPSAGSPSASSPSPSPDPSSTAPAPARRASPTPREPVEARRALLDRIVDDPTLEANAATLRAHFGGAVPARLSLQSVDGERRLVLVDDGASKDPVRPLLLVVDAPSKIAWSKERPIAGITPPVGSIAIAAGPRGRVALAACDPPTRWVALRLWDEDGAPFADFQVMEVEGCEDVSLFYWPRHGWLVAAARAGVPARVQLVTEAGVMAWGRAVPLGAAWRAAAPPTFAADTDGTFVLAQYTTSDDGKADRAVAYRYDAAALAQWATPTTLGVVPKVPLGRERVTLARPREGVVRATLATGAEIDLASSGEAKRRGK